MKKLVFLMISLLLILTSCVTTQKVFMSEPNIPEDQVSFLIIPNYVKVIEFDGKPVNWATSPLALDVVIGISAGNHDLIIDTIVGDKNIASIPTIKGKSYTVTFEAGKSYQFIKDGNSINIINNSNQGTLNNALLGDSDFHVETYEKGGKLVLSKASYGHRDSDYNLDSTFFNYKNKPFQ